MANTINVTVSKQELTPMAKALYSKVNTVVDEYEGKKKYEIHAIMDKETAAPLMKQCAEWMKAVESDPAVKGKKWNPPAYTDYNIGYKVLDDGNVDFRFRTAAFYKDKNSGETFQKYVSLFDKYGKSMGKDVSIGNGSDIVVRFAVGGYYMNAVNHGLNLYLTGIMVDKLIEGGNGEDASGFHFAAAPSPQEVMGGNENGADVADGADNGSGEPSVDDDPFA